MCTQELERVDADRKARRTVVGKHPLPNGRFGQVGRLSRRLERERELLLLPARPRDRLRARDEAELPEQGATWKREAVAGAGDDQRLDAVLGQLRALREVAHAREPAGARAVLDDRLRIVFADAVHIVEADANGSVFHRALRAADVDV